MKYSLLVAIAFTFGGCASKPSLLDEHPDVRIVFADVWHAVGHHTLDSIRFQQTAEPDTTLCVQLGPKARFHVIIPHQNGALKRIEMTAGALRIKIPTGDFMIVRRAGGASYWIHSGDKSADCSTRPEL